MSPSRSQYSAEHIPFPENLIYLTKDGKRLCHTHAEQDVQYMVRRKVTGYKTSLPEVCDECGTVL